MAAPTIDDVQFPPNISKGAVGGPAFSTVVIASASGVEQRVAQWAIARREWDVSHALRDPTEATTLVDFFLARQGKARGFRFKNWHDFSVTEKVLAPTGAKTVQLIKTSTSGPASYVQDIYKPVASPAVTLRRATVSFTDFTLDTTTGLVTFTVPDKTFSITAITQAASAVVTTSATHSFVIGEELFIEGVSGMTEINSLVGTVTDTPSGTEVELDIDSSGFSTYTGGGTIAKYVQSSEALDWTGEFDVPVRFDTDKMELEQADVNIRNWKGIPILELRG